MLEVVSDRKLGQLLYTYSAVASGTHVYNAQSNEYIYVGTGGTHDQSGSTTEVNYDKFLPEVISFSDYYPFLMKMQGRYDNAAGYRYQGQAQEEDNEFSEGMLAFEYRTSDPRIGRFLSIDPLRQKYPHNSPYAFSENRVISAVEIEGKEGDDMSPYYYDPQHAYADYERRAAEPFHHVTTEEFWIRVVDNIELAIRMATPVDEVHGVIFGEDLDGTPYNRMAAFTFLMLDLVAPEEHMMRSAIKGKRLYRSIKVSNVSIIDESVANAPHIKSIKNWDPPYTGAVTETRLEESTEGFVRFYREGKGNPEGDWIAPIEEVQGLTPKEIQQKYSLQYVPNRMKKVKINMGADIRIGTAAARKKVGGGRKTVGGGTQVEIINKKEGQVEYGKEQKISSTETINFDEN